MIKALSPKGIIRDESGQNTVEFALILPILLAIVFGILDFGWLFFNMALVSNSARTGARYAIVNYGASGDDIPTLRSMTETKIKDGLPSYLKNSTAGLNVTVAEDKTAASPYEDVFDVTIKVKIPLFTPVISTITGHQYYQMEKTVTMRKES